MNGEWLFPSLNILQYVLCSFSYRFTFHGTSFNANNFNEFTVVATLDWISSAIAHTTKKKTKTNNNKNRTQNCFPYFRHWYCNYIQLFVMLVLFFERSFAHKMGKSIFVQMNTFNRLFIYFGYIVSFFHWYHGVLFTYIPSLRMKMHKFNYF